MKGLILSLAVFVGYVLWTMVVSHLTRPTHYSRVFVPAMFVWAPAYFVAYFALPADLGFLPAAWMARPAWLDAAYGCLVLALNVHSYMDFFFACNGGFSMSMMLEILRKGGRGAKTDELVAKYMRPDGYDRIYTWRLPRLAEAGWITLDKTSGSCGLTAVGRTVARIAAFLKRMLNLGEGG